MGLLSLLGWRRQRPLRELSADDRAYVALLMANGKDEFLTLYWQFVLGNTEKGYHRLQSTLKAQHVTLSQGDWIVTRSFWLAKTARRMGRRAADALQKLGGEARTYWLQKLNALTIQWDALQFDRALCVDERGQTLGATLGPWVDRATPHLNRVLWDWTTDRINATVSEVIAELDLESKYRNDLIGLVGGAYYYEAINEIVRMGQLDTDPKRFRSVLNPTWIRGPLRVQ